MFGVWEVVRNVSTPLILSGLAVTIMYLLFRTILKMDIFRPLSKQMGGKLLFKIINIIFVIALVSVIFGFAGYLMDKIYPPIDTGYVNIDTDKDLPLQSLISAIAKGRNVTVFFQESCDETLRKSVIEAGTHDGRSIRELLENIQKRAKGKSLAYKVSQEGEKRYEIACD